jgi:hypothetical protein
VKRKISPLDRILLLITGLLAAYLVVMGVEGLPVLVTWAYSTAFGVLLIAGLLIIINGFEVLDSPLVVIIAAIIPLGLSLGMVIENLPPNWHLPYLAFVVIGFLTILLTRFLVPERTATIVLATVHGVAGLLIFSLPIILVLQGEKAPMYLFMSAGGALIGIGGMLLAFLKSGRPILSAERIFMLLPWILLLMSTSFALGLGA